ncbi:hypothetical protein AHAS_Ahas19G0202300 [Arachis hypogaea]
MMHVCPMQAMRSCVGLHPASRHYLGTIGTKLNPIIYAQGEIVILSSWASLRSTHKQNKDPQFVGFPEINTQINRNPQFIDFPEINIQQNRDPQFVVYTRDQHTTTH